MAVSVAQFRADFPEFSSTTRFPTGQISFWLTVAYAMLNANRWGNQLDLAAELYAAHHSSLERKALDESVVASKTNAGTPGQSTGPINSRSVDKASVAYSADLACEEKAGHWNLTIYGTRLYRLIKLFGMGPVYVGGSGVSPLWDAEAWQGPPFWPGWYGST